MTEESIARSGAAAVIGSRPFAEAGRGGFVDVGFATGGPGGHRPQRLGAVLAVLGALTLVVVAGIVLATGGLYWSGAFFLGAMLIGTDRYDRRQG